MFGLVFVLFGSPLFENELSSSVLCFALKDSGSVNCQVPRFWWLLVYIELLASCL